MWQHSLTSISLKGAEMKASFPFPDSSASSPLLPHSPISLLAVANRVGCTRGGSNPPREDPSPPESCQHLIPVLAQPGFPKGGCTLLAVLVLPNYYSSLLTGFSAQFFYFHLPLTAARVFTLQHKVNLPCSKKCTAPHNLWQEVHTLIPILAFETLQELDHLPLQLSLLAISSPFTSYVLITFFTLCPLTMPPCYFMVTYA